jgi:hypothetical protein
MFALAGDAARRGIPLVLIWISSPGAELAAGQAEVLATDQASSQRPKR